MFGPVDGASIMSIAVVFKQDPGSIMQIVLLWAGTNLAESLSVSVNERQSVGGGNGYKNVKTMYITFLKF